MPHPIVTSLTLAAAVTNGIAQSQSLPGASGLAMVLNGSLVVTGVGQLGVSRRVVIHSDGNDSGITFTIVGTRANGWANTALTEVVTGANVGDATSTQDFLTVTSITASAATASTVYAGTGGTGSGPWVVWDKFLKDFLVSIAGYATSGSPTWGVEYTYDDCFGLWLPSTVLFPRPWPLTSMTGLTVATEGSLTGAGVVASRLTLTAVGGVQLTQQQQGGP